MDKYTGDILLFLLFPLVFNFILFLSTLTFSLYFQIQYLISKYKNS